MRLLTLSTMALALFASPAIAQHSLEFDTPKTAAPGEMVVLSAAMTDGDMLKVKIGQPFGMETLVYRVFDESGDTPVLIRSDIIFKMPNSTVNGWIDVINFKTGKWEDRQFSIAPRGPPEDPEPDVPEEPVDPPLGNYKESPLYQVTIDAYSTVRDREKQKWARQMATAFGYIGKQLRAGKYEDAESMLSDVRMANRGELNIPGVGQWPDSSRMQWTVFRTEVAKALDGLEQAGKLNAPADYAIHWKAIEQGLKFSGGFE